MVLAGAHWALLEPLIGACRNHAKVLPSHLGQTVEAILWRCQDGAKGRLIPAELGPLRGCPRSSRPCRDG